MNCDTCQDLLLEYLYEELDDDGRRQVESHLESCQACAGKLETLRLGRAAVRKKMDDDPSRDDKAILAGVFAASGLETQDDDEGVYRPRWFAPALAAAAVVLAVAGLWLTMPDPDSYVRAEMPAPQIIRKGVSLTILSTPPDTHTIYPGPDHADRRRPWQLSNQWKPGYEYGWPGLALVRDERAVTNLPRGASTVRFPDVPTAIIPDSVRLGGAGGNVDLLEQNYQYDLASASAVLDRYIDKPLTLALDGGGSVSGTLLSYDAAFLVLRPGGEGPRSVPRSQVRSITFSELPEGLLSKPTLMWKLDNTGPARQDMTVAYLTYGLKWRADYVLKFTGGQETKKDPDGQIAIHDTADLVGYATVTNESGVTYEDAQLKLMAGDVNVEFPSRTNRALGEFEPDDSDGALKVQMTQRSFFEYHLYTLGRKTTIRDRQTKQIEMITASAVKLKRSYVYRPKFDKHIAVVSELVNEEANQLGKPLPKGQVRLWVAPVEGQEPVYASSSRIDHTPKDEKIRFQWGHAFDLVGLAKALHTRKLGPDHWQEDWQYTLRNHKSYPVTVTLVLDLSKTTYEIKSSHDWHARQVGVVEIDVTIEPNAEAVVNVTHRYDNGGGRWVGAEKRTTDER